MAGGTVLILGSGPDAPSAADWPRSAFDHVVAINNAWRVRPDWSALVYPADFPSDRLPPQPGESQRLVGEDEFVPAQNAYGGFVFGGGTMAFTAGYWALHALRPRVLAWFGCDMIYAPGRTHFYGKGQADPLRADVTLQSLEAKSARLMALAAAAGCACVNLSTGPSRLVFPRGELGSLSGSSVQVPSGIPALRADEDATGYLVPSGRYWEEADRFDPAVLAAFDRRWLALWDRAAGAA